MSDFDIKNIAKLASINLSAEEQEKLTNDLSIILEHVQALSSLELDTNIEDVFIHPLEKELKQVELEEKLYGKAQMELVAKHRMREVATWSKLKKEFDDGNFDKRDVNTHQAKSYLLRLQRQKETITPGTSQPEVFNVLGQLQSIERIKKDHAQIEATKKPILPGLTSKG